MVLGDLETEKRLIDNLIFKIIGIIAAVALFVLFIWSKKNSKKTDIVKAEITKAKEEKQEKVNIETNISIGKITFDIQKLADDFRTFQQLNIENKYESHVEQEYGLTKAGYEKSLSDNILNSKSPLNIGLAYYLKNDTINAIPIFIELTKETHPPEIRAISNSYLGRIGVSKANYSKETIDYLLQAENLFKKFKTDDDDINKVRASNFYDLGFYYKTHSHNFKLSQTNYLKAIEIYENINDNISGTYSSKLGTVYNDLYILTKEGKLKGNPFLLLKRALFYKRESLDNNYDRRTFLNYINSLKILGNYYNHQDDFSNSINQFEEAIELINNKISDEPLEKEFKLSKAGILTRFSEVLISKYKKHHLNEDLSKAKNNLNLAGVLFEENITETPLAIDVMQLRQYFYSKGTLSRLLNDIPQALTDFNQSLKFAKILISEDKNDIDLILFKAHIFYELSVTYMHAPNKRDCVNAKKYAQKAIKIYKANKNSRKYTERFLDDMNHIVEKCG